MNRDLPRFQLRLSGVWLLSLAGRRMPRLKFLSSAFSFSGFATRARLEHESCTVDRVMIAAARGNNSSAHLLFHSDTLLRNDGLGNYFSLDIFERLRNDSGGH